jgi:hypothetical protein
VAAFAVAVGLPEESAVCVAEGPATVAFGSDVLFVLFVRAITGAVEASRAEFHSTKVSPGCVAQEVDGGCQRVSKALCVVSLVAGKICGREGRDFLTAV